MCGTSHITLVFVTSDLRYGHGSACVPTPETIWHRRGQLFFILAPYGSYFLYSVGWRTSPGKFHISKTMKKSQVIENDWSLKSKAFTKIYLLSAAQNYIFLQFTVIFKLTYPSYCPLYEQHPHKTLRKSTYDKVRTLATPITAGPTVNDRPWCEMLYGRKIYTYSLQKSLPWVTQFLSKKPWHMQLLQILKQVQFQCVGPSSWMLEPCCYMWTEN